MPETPDPFADSSDPLVDEVRAIREAISDESDNDVAKLCQHLRQLERQAARRFVTTEDRLKPIGG